MKRLYISDLDGTLLGADQRISVKSSEILCSVIADGGYFTFATARTAASAVKIMETVPVNVPCILMNGVCLYDLQKREYVRCEYIPAEKAREISQFLDEHDMCAFMYKVTGGKLSCEYTGLGNAAMREFYEMRKKRYDKPFEQVESFLSASTDEVIYFALLDTQEKLEPVRRAAESIDGLRYEYYRDIYNEELWYLEISSEKASKYSGVQYLREEYGFDEIIAFGDNFNDIPLFEAADVKIAVENAKPELKAAADIIIPSNNENGVAVWIAENHFDES